MLHLSCHWGCAPKGGGDSGWTGKVLAPSWTPRALRHSTSEVINCSTCTQSLDPFEGNYAALRKSRIFDE